MATEKQKAETAPKNIYQRISAVMQDVQRLQKDKEVGSGNYAYKAMSEEKVTTALRDAMINHGLVLMPVAQTHTLVDYIRLEKLISISSVDVTYKLVNIDNPAEFELIVSSGTGVDSQDKGVGKAMTYSMKYALLRLFMIPTGNDPDAIHNAELEAQQQAQLEAAQKELHEATAKLLNVNNKEEMANFAATLPDYIKKHDHFRKAAGERQKQFPKTESVPA